MLLSSTMILLIFDVTKEYMLKYALVSYISKHEKWYRDMISVQSIYRNVWNQKFYNATMFQKSNFHNFICDVM